MCDDSEGDRAERSPSTHVIQWRAPSRQLTGLCGFSLSIAATGETTKALFSNSPDGERLTCKADDEPPPDLLTAVKEQLGLKLDSGTGPLDLLVIEHIEKKPTEN